jgi:hypothetical protein
MATPTVIEPQVLRHKINYKAVYLNKQDKEKALVNWISTKKIKITDVPPVRCIQVPYVNDIQRRKVLYLVIMCYLEHQNGRSGQLVIYTSVARFVAVVANVFFAVSKSNLNIVFKLPEVTRSLLKSTSEDHLPFILNYQPRIVPPNWTPEADIPPGFEMNPMYIYDIDPEGIRLKFALRLGVMRMWALDENFDNVPNKDNIYVYNNDYIKE